MPAFFGFAAIGLSRRKFECHAGYEARKIAGTYAENGFLNERTPSEAPAFCLEARFLSKRA